MQWHPLFAYLLRPLLQDYYDVETNVSVGDLPRSADITLLRRTAAGPIPFKAIWSHLTPWNVLEFKGPTVDPRLTDPDLLIEVGLGVERRLNDEQERQRQPRVGRGEVSYWYIANHLGWRFLAEVELLLGHPPERLGEGLWRFSCLGRSLFLVSNDLLPVDRESVPLHLVSREPRERELELARQVVMQPGFWKTYGPWLAYLHPEILKEVQAMAKTAEIKLDLDLDIRPLIAQLGVPTIVHQMDVKAVVDALGMDAKAVVDALGVEQILSSLTPEQREEFKRRLQ